MLRSRFLIAAAALATLVVGCKKNSSSKQSSPEETGAKTTESAGAKAQAPEKPSGTVSVLYAGSLVNLMEKDMGPAFSKATGIEYEGEGKGSTALANMIKDKLRQPDVFVSASAKVNDILMGDEGHHQESWYAVIFRNEMVIAYNDKSKFAGEFAKVKDGKEPFYQPLMAKGFRLGRTDPKLDPKGFRTLMMFDLAEKLYKKPGLGKKILGDAESSTQTFPEEQLVARLESGQIDAGVFYRNEAQEHGLPYVTLPKEINLSDPALDDQYKTASYKNPESGKEYHGGAIVYTVTVLDSAKNPAAGAAFVKFMMSNDGKALLDKHGLPVIAPTVEGDASKVPAALKDVLSAAAASPPEGSGK